jgi:hypothetical protein
MVATESISRLTSCNSPHERFIRRRSADHTCGGSMVSHRSRRHPVTRVSPSQVEACKNPQMFPHFPASLSRCSATDSTRHGDDPVRDLSVLRLRPRVETHVVGVRCQGVSAKPRLPFFKGLHRPDRSAPSGVFQRLSPDRKTPNLTRTGQLLLQTSLSLCLRSLGLFAVLLSLAALVATHDLSTRDRAHTTSAGRSVGPEAFASDSAASSGQRSTRVNTGAPSPALNLRAFEPCLTALIKRLAADSFLPKM